MQTNLNMLFQQMIPNFAHLIEIKPKTKAEFLQSISDTYCLSNQKTMLFYESVKSSTFETIRLNNTKETILFNQ